MKKAWPAAAILLFACNSAEDKSDRTEAAPGTIEEPTGDDAASALQPGQWEATTQMLSMTGSSDPMPAPLTIGYCLRPEDSTRSDGFIQAGRGAGCKMTDFTMAKGLVRGAARCGEGETALQSSFEGRFTATNYEFTSREEVLSQGKRETIVQRTVASRKGECPKGKEHQITITS